MIWKRFDWLSCNHIHDEVQLSHVLYHANIIFYVAPNFLTMDDGFELILWMLDVFFFFKVSIHLLTFNLFISFLKWQNRLLYFGLHVHIIIMK